MIKIFSAVLSAAAMAVFAAGTLAPSTADAAARRAVKAKPVKANTYAGVSRRHASVAQNGLCQRDTGTADDKLDFRNKCDVEEYWTRLMNRGSGADR